ncbi:MAG: DUF92 domain-containing protein [Christensenellaceae bacterium]|jgi:uncharacterized protein (TIGR00297 family)|nr:DUF92 domain-containing protein [Christensenellaceae bacterium]
MGAPWLPFALCAALTSLICLFSWKKRLLRQSACVLALLTGLCFFLFGGWLLWGMLILFFMSSSLAGKLGKHRRAGAGREGTGRRAAQVLANSLPALIAAFFYWLGGQAPLLMAALGAIAAAASDTWASEIGVLSRKSPVSILTLRPVRAGLSGGISPLGCLAGALGSLCIALPAGLVLLSFPAFWAVFLGGCGGCVADSLLGASLQAKYLGQDGELTEEPYGPSGPNRLFSGLRSMNNDWVNGLSAAGAALLSSCFWLLFRA